MITSLMPTTGFNYSAQTNSTIIHSPFASFWMAGYECADHLNTYGNRVDFLNTTGHIDLIYEDYARLKDFNISTVREGIRWSYVEQRPYTYNFAVVQQMLKAARLCGIRQVWDLCHFGYPEDLSPLHPHFTKRFVALCRAFIQAYRSVNSSETIIVTPVNEVNFISWLGGHVAGTTPYCRNNGWEVKAGLMKAYIAGVAAIKQMDNNVIVMSTEPLVNMVAATDASQEEIEFAALQHRHQYQATDILCGYICPELNGRPEYLDIIGLNYYYNNQWIVNTGKFLVWTDEPKDARWKPLSHLIQQVYQRYQKPVVISETSHPKEDRPLWIMDIARELNIVLENNIPLLGCCIYPVIDRPDWDDLLTWHQAGLWDITYQNGKPERVLYQPYAQAFLQAQQLLSNHVINQNHKDVVSMFEYEYSVKTY